MQVYVRIIARYLAGALVTYGLIEPSQGASLALDPDFAVVIGGGLGLAAEVAYGFARRLGWGR